MKVQETLCYLCYSIFESNNIFHYVFQFILSRVRITHLIYRRENLSFLYFSHMTEVFYKKDVPTNFAKFLGCGLRPAFLKKEGLTQTFSCGFCKFLRTPFYRTVVASVEYYFRILFKVYCPQYVRIRVVRINLLFFRMECYNT